jgi:four helix bundle protein
MEAYPMDKFDHERLHVYHTSIEFMCLADQVACSFAAGRAYLGDQLHRAATSIVLNVAEGAGEFSKKEKARFYRLALRSATECAAIVDVCKHLHLAPETHLLAGREMLLRILAMLVALVRKVGQPAAARREASKQASGTGSGWGSGKTGGAP